MCITLSIAYLMWIHVGGFSTGENFPVGGDKLTCKLRARISRDQTREGRLEQDFFFAIKLAPVWDNSICFYFAKIPMNLFSASKIEASYLNIYKYCLQSFIGCAISHFAFLLNNRLY